MRKILLAIMLLSATMMQSTELLAEDGSWKMSSVALNVDSVDMKNHLIVVNDMSYKVADYVIVRGANNKVISKNSLKAGDKINFTTSASDGDGGVVITEIWMPVD